MAVKLGELLLKAKLINGEQLAAALKQQKESGVKLGETLVRLGFVTEDDITETLSAQFGVPSINLTHFEIDPNVLKLVPADVARKYNILPVNKTGATLTIAMADPTNVFAMDDLKFMTGYNVEPVVASEIALQHAIDRNYGASHALELKKVMEEMSAVDASDTSLEVVDEEEQDAIDLEKLVEEGEEAPVVRLVNIILTDAIKRGASDIHIEPYEKEYRVRYRVDGAAGGGDEPSEQAQGSDRLAHQDPRQARHRREAAPAGRAHQDQDEARGEGEGARLPRQRPADPLRREDRLPSPRQGQPDARHDEAGLRAVEPPEVREGDPRARGGWSS